MSKQELKQIKAAHSLSIKDIAEICGVSYDSAKSWLYRKKVDVPENMIRLLNFELSAKYDNKLK